MWPSTHPKQYQDVKVTLRWYAAAAFAAASLFAYLLLLPNTHKTPINDAISGVTSSDIVGSGLSIVLLGFTGWALIFLFEIHDKIYDKHVIKWRAGYDLDFIIPNLYRPFCGNVDPGFFRAAEASKDTFMEPYYRFVGDSAEHKISENLIVRFYEAATKYWVSQINELFLIGLLILTFAYYIVYRNMELALDPIVIGTMIITVLLALNRLFVRMARNEVRQKTKAEIEEIHARHLAELESELLDLHERQGLQYSEARE